MKDCGLKTDKIFDLHELKADGFTIKELVEEGLGLKELKVVAMRLLCDCHVIAMWLLCDCYAIAM